MLIFPFHSSKLHYNTNIETNSSIYQKMHLPKFINLDIVSKFVFIGEGESFCNLSKHPHEIVLKTLLFDKGNQLSSSNDNLQFRKHMLIGSFIFFLKKTGKKFTKAIFYFIINKAQKIQKTRIQMQTNIDHTSVIPLPQISLILHHHHHRHQNHHDCHHHQKV